MTTPIVGRPPVVNDEGEQDTVYVDWVEFHDLLLSQLFAREPETTPGWCPEWRTLRSGLHGDVSVAGVGATEPRPWRRASVVAGEPGDSCDGCVVCGPGDVLRVLVGQALAGC